MKTLSSQLASGARYLHSLNTTTFDVLCRVLSDYQPVFLCSICDDEELMESVSFPRVSRGKMPLLILEEYKVIKVLLNFNVTLDGLWTVYTYQYDEHSLGKHTGHIRSRRVSS